MTRISFKVMATSIAALMMLVSALNGAATTGPRPAASAGVDLSSETRAVDGFGDDLTRFEFTCQDLARKQSLTALELNSARTAAAGLKLRVSQTQQAFRSAIDKLKAAKLWDKLDSVLPPITDARAKRLIQQKGGAQKILEQAAAQLGGLSPDIDSLIQPLSSKVRGAAGSDYEDERLPEARSRVVRAAFNPSAPITLGFTRCMLRFGIFLLKPTDHNAALGICACDSEPGDESYCRGGANFSPR